MRGEPVITVRVNWLMGEEHLDPPWSFGPGRERFEVEITGDPPVKVTFHGLHPGRRVAAGLERNPGIVATAMHCVNAIPYVCAPSRASAPISTCRLVCGRADPSLAAPEAPRDPRPLQARPTASRS